jgi:mRNA-degrading endonuclease RelE of RelBE toxin-antitoxin system
MNIQQTPHFAKTFKKLHRKEQKILEQAIKDVAETPDLGRSKTGDIAGVRVHKFMLNNQRVLLAYKYADATDSILLLEFGPHENFYRDLKKHYQ